LLRRDVREAEGARLESVCTFTGTVGSNPTLSATNLFQSACRDNRARFKEQSPNPARTGREQRQVRCSGEFGHSVGAGTLK
jgi:hypothetical protein